MAKIRSFKREAYPADTRTMGTDDARPPSGYFSLHFTYPDTEYTDATATTWAAGGNNLGMHFLVRTKLANDSVGTYANGDNFFVIDLKRASEAATAASSSLTYDLGSKEAAMMIASAINSSRDYQTGSHSRGRYLRAKYQKMSGKETYQGTNNRPLGFLTGGEGGSLKWQSENDYAKGSTNVIDVKEAAGGSVILTTIHEGDKIYTAGANSRYVGTVANVISTRIYFQDAIATDLFTSDPIRLGKVEMMFGELYLGTDTNKIPALGLPSDIPQKGKMTTTISSTTYTLYYDSWTVGRDDNFVNTDQGGVIMFNVYDYDTAFDFDGIAGTEPIWTIDNDTKQQHTVVVSWESDTPTGGGYWGTANGGPIVQGLGAPLPVWYLAAKPMDGGNMGLPDIGHESRGAQPSALSGHGYSRFSIEGLNSCALPDLPPPDMPFDGPSIMGEVAADPFQWTGLTPPRSTVQKDTLLLEENEFGTLMDSIKPRPTNCYISTNADIAPGATELKIIAPNTVFKDHFDVGDTIYTEEGEVVGVINNISDIHSSGLRAIGPKHRSSGVQIVRGLVDAGITANGNVGVGSSTTINTNGDPRTAYNIGDIVYGGGLKSFPVGKIQALTASSITLEANNAMVIINNYPFYHVPRGTSTYQYLVFNDDVSSTFVIGDVLYDTDKNQIGTVAELTVDGEPTTIGIVGASISPLKSDLVPLKQVVNYEIISKIVATGNSYTTATNVATTSATGLGMTVNYTAYDGGVVSVQVHTAGSGYSVGDVITITGGGGNATFTYTGKPAGVSYTSSDFDAGEELQVYNDDPITVGATASAFDPEAFGDNGSIYAYTNENNPRTILESASGILATALNATLGDTRVPYTTSSIILQSHDGEIANDLPLYRAVSKITLSSATTVNLFNGQGLFKSKDNAPWSVMLENGYKMLSDFSTHTNSVDGEYAEMSNLYQSSVARTKAVAKFGLKSENTLNATSTNPFVGEKGFVSRPYRTTRDVNTQRVRGLFVSNEEMVWESLSVVDDKGQELILEGGSPFGTVIKDFTYKQTRVNPNTGTETPLPSTVGSGIEPNLEINLPSQDEIPGNIIVRSGHDRVQAWSNLTWGMGGLSAPTTGLAGEDEQSSKSVRATAFDTHDRMLHFHPVRIIHDKLEGQFGLNTNAVAGGVPSGTTRLFAAHRLSDHTERGSVLKDTDNGVDGSYLHPHHRIRFGRQGHHFVAPLTMRGTPMALRRQLHRSHGSAYSLLFEAETENKHWGFQSTYNGGTAPNPSATTYYLDTLEVKSYAYNTGSFAADGFPMDEIKNAGLPNWRRYNGATPHEKIDVLFAPGQLHTKVEGATEQAQWVSDYHPMDVSNWGGPYGNNITNGPIALTVDSRTVNNRHNAGEEFTLNGFMLSQYTLMGGRPEPAWNQKVAESLNGDTHHYTMTGHPAGWRTARVGTELATVPPLIAHDPEMVNASAVPVAIVESPSSASDFEATDSHADMALVGSSDTNSQSIPDAFLCTWLAEYSHPALLGTNREHYMTFRYREAGMPNAVDQPSVRGLYLRNAPAIDSGSVDKGMPFERIYAFQWLQQYGYNGLNAGGHGTNWGQRAANAVLMGHSGLREPHGTLRLPHQFTLRGVSVRQSRGEGIGDGLNPRKIFSRWVLDQDTTNSYKWNQMFVVNNPMVALDWSRRLPLRAFGFKTGSDALNMLAGDPSETSSSMNAILRSARYDGGKHDSMNDMEKGVDWAWESSATYTGVERNTPIGIVVSQQTNEGFNGQGFNRLSNDPWTQKEKRVGMGRVLQNDNLGMVSPRAMPSGVMDAHRTEFATITGSSAKFLQAKSVNTGSDPIIGLNHHSGDRVKAADSVEANYQSSEFTATVGNEFYHHKGNNLHLNAHPVDVKINGETDNQHFPAVGWGKNLNMKDKGQAERGTLPIPLHEIADHRQVQSDLSPRLGMSVETHSEFTTGKNTDYIITSTKAVSLHSDLAVGQVFPLTPSWVQETRWTKYGGSTGSITTSATRPDETYGGQSNPNQKSSKPKWTLNENTDLNALSNPHSDSIQQADGAGIRDHWAVRGSADLPAWGGVFILRKTWLERGENNELLRSKEAGTNAANKVQVAQPVRQYADYIVRMVRPLKVFGYTSQNDSDGNAMNQDGWLLGPYSTITQAGDKDQPFTRDKRYGMFETSTESQIGDIQGISSPYDSAPTMEWPDANDRDVVWHLIPSANMLQHFKADASRKNRDGTIDPLIDPRYSQSTHPGGGETISQTETVYATDETVVVNPYMRREKDVHAVIKQPANAMSALGPRATVKIDAKGASPYTLTVNDATAFPKTGTLVVLGLSGQVSYTGRTETSFTGITATEGCLVDLTGYELRPGANSTTTASKIANIVPVNVGLVVLPSLVDNAVSMGLLLTDKWDATSSDDSTIYNTNMTYRGIGHYNPSDFFMLTPQSFVLTDGQSTGVLRYKRKPGVGGLSKVYIDGNELSTNRYAPYLIDGDNKVWRISDASVNTVDGDSSSTTLSFRNLADESLSASGIDIESVILGQYMGVGVRTTDAALMLLKDIEKSLPGADLETFRIFHEQQTTDTGVYAAYSSAKRSLTASRQSFLFAHPSLRDGNLHSRHFVSRQAKGIGIMDVLRDLSRIDGYQLALDDGGNLIYSPEVFKGRGRRVGTSSGPRSVSVSQMLEMANQVIVEGDAIAMNETVRGSVKDLEKMKEMGGVGGDEGVQRTLRTTVAGVKERSVAIRLAKGILNRTEQGASLIRVEGLIKCTDIKPGEILHVDFSVEGIKGEFAVFEAEHDYNSGLTNIVIGQYEKGIEGLLADLQSSTAETQEDDPTRSAEQINLTLNAPIRVVSASRVLTRFVNGTRTLIGGRWRGQPTPNQLGAIGVRGGATGITKNGAILAGATTSLVVQGTDATLRFNANDAVLTDSHGLIGFVQSVSATTITLKANNLVAIADGDRIRVSSARTPPIGHSKSVFYEVR